MLAFVCVTLQLAELLTISEIIKSQYVWISKQPSVGGCYKQTPLLQLVPETENGFHMLQGHRTGTNMFYEWSLKKRCIR